MSRDASVTLVWGDGEHVFRLPLGQTRELEEKRDTGIRELLRRLTVGTERADDIREVLRLGLIGGGMTPGGAHTLVARYHDNQPRGPHIDPAKLVLLAALIGAPDEPVGKAEATEAQPQTTATAV